MKGKLIFLLLIGFLASCIVTNQPNNTISDEDLELIDYLFDGAKGSNPGANLLVIKNGEKVYQQSYGLSNVEQGINSVPETNYRIASVSKSFTAMAIMILENEGKLSYETKLTEIFLDFPEYGNSINVRHLLTHQSGIIDYEEFISEERTEQMLDVDVFQGLKLTDSTYFQSGSEYRYSNSGYALLAIIVEKISGTSFADFMNREVFEKLDMDDTQVFQVDQSIENRAYGYSIQDDSIIYSDQSLTSAIQGDGGIYSNVSDYYKWDQALYTDKLIPLEKLEAAFYDYDNNNKTNSEGYGYGWSIDYKKGSKIISHSGGTTGFETWVTRIPSQNLSVIIFANRDGHDRHLMHRMNALISIYSDYEIPMPIEILMKKEIDQQNMTGALEIYDNMKDSDKYEYSSTTPSYLGFEYYRMNKYDIAETLFVKDTLEHPYHFGGYYGLGLAYKKTSQLEKAKLNLQKVMELTAEDEPSMLRRATNHLNEIKDMQAMSKK